MNEGWLLLLTVVGTIGAALTVVYYRDLIWPERYPPAAPLRRTRPRRPPATRPRRPPASETTPKRTEAISSNVSGVTTLQTDAETISFRTLAKLVQAGVLTETVALEATCNVKAGSSKAYQAAREKLKKPTPASTVG